MQLMGEYGLDPPRSTPFTHQLFVRPERNGGRILWCKAGGGYWRILRGKAGGGYWRILRCKAGVNQV
jgi:hypothetical protein